MSQSADLGSIPSARSNTGSESDGSSLAGNQSGQQIGL